MKIKEIFKNYVQGENRKREKGKFYASEVGSIIKGYLNEEDFYEERKIDAKGVRNIMSGQAFEAEFKRALEHSNADFKHEPRYEVSFDDITITTKPDFEFDDVVIETKFPVSQGTPEEYLERYKHQLEIEYQATKKKVYLGIFSHPFKLDLYLYEPKKETFEEIKKVLKTFNKFL